MQLATASPITWEDTFSINVSEIDEQHKKLVRLINGLLAEISQGQRKAIIDKTLGEIFKYAAAAFKTEEHYFEEFGYPETTAHKKAHTYFVATLAAFKADFGAVRAEITIAVTNVLRDWLKDHIEVTDKKYGSFFKRNGLN